MAKKRGNGFSLESALANAGTGTSGTPAVDPKTSKPIVAPWEALYQKPIDFLGYTKSFAGPENTLLKNMINGNFKGILSNPEVSNEVKGDIKGYEKNAFAAMNLLKTYADSKGKTGNIDQFNKYMHVADSFAMVLNEKAGPNSNGNYVFDFATGTMPDRTKYELDTDVVLNSNIFSTQANYGAGATNPLATYEQDNEYRELQNKAIVDRFKPVLASWGKQAFALLNTDSKVAKRIDPDNRLNTYNYAKTILNHVSKYGTVSGNASIDKKNKDRAASIIKKLNAAGGDYEDWLEIIKAEANTGTSNYFTDVVNVMGFYGTTTMFQASKNTFGKQKKYFSTAQNEVDNMDDFDDMITEQIDFTKYMSEEYKKVRTNAMARADTDLRTRAAFNSLVLDGESSIVDYATWKKRMANQSDGTLPGFQTTRMVPRGDGRFYMVKDEPSTGKKDYTKGLEGNWLDELGSTVGNALYFGTGIWAMLGQDDPSEEVFYSRETLNEIKLKKLYDKTVYDFKKEFTTMNSPVLFKGKVILAGGTGNTADKELYMHVDMSLDKNKRMINTTMEKSKAANAMLNLMKNENGSVNSTDVTLMDNYDISEGLHKGATAETLKELKEFNKTKFDKFFNNSDLSNIRVTFDRNASLDKHSTYTFYNRKTDKSLVMVAPYSYLEKNEEKFWVGTKMNDSEYRYQRRGYKTIPDKDKLYRNAIIKDGDSGGKVGIYEYLSDDGVWTPSIPRELGDVDIITATNTFNESLREWERNN